MKTMTLDDLKQLLRRIDAIFINARTKETRQEAMLARVDTVGRISKILERPTK
jgi:hypothetical protein